MSLGFAFLFLFASFFLGTLQNFLKQERLANTTLDKVGHLFFYRPLQRFFFPKNELHNLGVAVFCSKCLCLLTYTAFIVYFLLQHHLFPPSHNIILSASALFVFASLALFFAEFLPLICASFQSTQSFAIASPLASIFLILSFPISFIFLQFSQIFSTFFSASKKEHAEIKEEIVSMIDETHQNENLDLNEKKLIESALSFRDRVVHEVMVPRVDLFCLAESTPIEEAAKLAVKEGYSRIPVFSEDIDHISGVLMYKDLLAIYIDAEKKKPKSIKEIIKAPLYTPETKKISQLLQEFRNKQTHLAIVVDEYGGTEGIVTIEDILEEIVGEIADEYDKEEKLFSILPHGGWIVDGRMSILDIEEELGLKIPQDGEYDSIGGYIFHRSGSIPTKGLTIHHNDFEIEILSSDERSIKKVRITPLHG